MRAPSTSMLVCSIILLLAAAGSASGDAGQGQPTLILNRFGRQLKMYEAPVASYLIPTERSQLCTGPDCCQEDDYASPHRVMMLNSSRSVSGNRTYTTFFMSLTRTQCVEEVDNVGCCNANISTIWIDVDPALKVRFATLNGQQAAITPKQDEYGFRMSVNSQAAVAPDATVLSVTVEGAVDNLCPLPDIAPVSGLCDIIVEGGTPSNSKACCPRGLSTLSSNPWEVPQNYFSCVAEGSSSPFNLQLASVSDVFTDAIGDEYVSYVFKLSRNQNCREGPNSCCGMVLDYMQLKVLDTAQVTGVTFGGKPLNHSAAPWNEPGQAGYKGLMISGLDKGAEDLPTEGLTLAVTVRVPVTATSMPQLCSVPVQGPNSGRFGGCEYYLHSDILTRSFCCPQGTTDGALGPVLDRSMCEPKRAVAINSTSMTFMYYQHLYRTTSTEVAFLLTNLNTAACNKQYCMDSCGWTLYVRDEIAAALTFTHEELSNSGKQVVTRGAEAAVSFTYGPSGNQSITYTFNAPGNTNLRQLCRPNAYPGQGNYPCAAKVKAAGVYAMVFFSEDDLVIKTNPPVTPPGFCESPKDMDDYCIRVNKARFNSPNTRSTVVDFLVGNNDPAVRACVSEPDDDIVKFKVMLQSGVVEELRTERALLPRDTAVFNRTSGVTWTWTPPNVNMTAHYTFNLKGVKAAADICVQGLPDQPDNTCPVQFESRQSCYIGFVPLSNDPALTWVSVGAEDSSSNAKVIGPAVAVPIAVVLSALALAFFLLRRRRNQYNRAEGSDLQAPLAGTGEGDLARLSAASADASDVQIRLQSSSGPGGVAH